MPPESLITHTLSRFPGMQRTDVIIDPLEKGGSDRKYYRVRFSQEHSLILVKYNDLREENRHYCIIAEYLDGLGVRVPKVYFHDDAEGLIWMEDLGERDLWSFRRESWKTQRELYHAALDQANRLHGRTCPLPETRALNLQVEFNAELYAWEQKYFIENCLQRYFEVAPGRIERDCSAATLQGIAERLGALPRTLVHRDFQSQNIIILNGEAFLIDFQGLRPGLPQYDLASLLYDPYVLMTDSRREELIQYCFENQTYNPGMGRDEFREILDLCAMQRLMQALGAYGYLGLVRERAHFLGYIPTAMESLRAVLARVKGTENLRGLLGELD